MGLNPYSLTRRPSLLAEDRPILGAREAGRQARRLAALAKLPASADLQRFADGVGDAARGYALAARRPNDNRLHAEISALHAAATRRNDRLRRISLVASRPATVSFRSVADVPLDQVERVSVPLSRR